MRSLISILFLIFVMTVSLQAQDIAEPTGLKKGELAPNFETVDQKGDTLKLDKLLEQGPVALFFYRGAWCPYCNRQMSELNDSLSAFEQKGTTVIAVTPETVDFIEKTVKKTNASFSIVQDKDYKIMNDYQVNFQVDDKTVKRYKLMGINLEKANGNSDNILPVPATYVIGQDGRIKYVYFNKDYKERAPLKDVLNSL